MELPCSNKATYDNRSQQQGIHYSGLSLFGCNRQSSQVYISSGCFAPERATNVHSECILRKSIMFQQVYVHTVNHGFVQKDEIAAVREHFDVVRLATRVCPRPRNACPGHIDVHIHPGRIQSGRQKHLRGEVWYSFTRGTRQHTRMRNNQMECLLSCPIC